MTRRGIRAGTRGAALPARPSLRSGTAQQADAAGGWPAYQSAVHSQTLPIMSYRPYPLAGNAPAGEVPSYPSSQAFWTGNSPCQVLAIHSPPGLNSSPQANSAPSSPPRAASSHSASVGTALPAQLAYAATSAQATCTTGWSGLFRIELPGPCGWRQFAPGTGFHQLYGSARLTRCRGGTNTLENGASSSGRAPG